MRHFPIYLALAAFAAATHAEVTVVTGHNNNGGATEAFSFPHVPRPAKNGTAGTFTIIDGQADGNGGGVDKLNDGKLPTEEDQRGENFFFNAGTEGGRLRLDLDEVKTIQQINTYSWHPNTRGPQVYKVYAATGTKDGFNAQPKRGTDPKTCGWTFIASVDTHPKDSDPGGQYGVSISDSAGPLGEYRYLLFDCVCTETDDQFGNTFYSEINVLGPAEVASAADSNAQTSSTSDENRQVLVLTGHVAAGDATEAFHIPRVPRPAKTGTAGTFTVIDGDIDGNSGGVEKLNDGKLPTKEDEPAENFFFSAGTPGGRLLVDLNEVKPIQQINTYSWHTGTRAPQVYRVYGATGAEAGFKSEPRQGTKPTTCGWTFIASADTRPRNAEKGGQYGVSIRGAAGALGDYRYILFDCSSTESTDQFGNTFYSEINVLGPSEVAPNGDAEQAVGAK